MPLNPTDAASREAKVLIARAQRAALIGVRRQLDASTTVTQLRYILDQAVADAEADIASLGGADPREVAGHA